MQENIRFIKDALCVLDTCNVLYSLERISPFFDDPKIYQYGNKITTKILGDNQPSPLIDIISSGYSFTSTDLALAKCLGEALERLCVYTFSPRSVSYVTCQKDAALKEYANYSDLVKHKKEIGVVKGHNATKDMPALIPAQLVYIHYNDWHNEQQLTEPNTTGASGGLTHESTLLRGIYEVVERDAFMTMYLGRLKPPRIDPLSLKSKGVQAILQTCDRYCLEVFLFDITNDLGIPAYVTFLIDRTGLGPAVCVGLRAGMDIEATIIGSLEESFVSRQWLRRHIYTEQKKGESFSRSHKLITTLLERGLFWVSASMIKKLDWLLDQEAKKVNTLPIHSFRSLKEELLYVRQIFLKNNMDVLYVDITKDQFKTITYKVYKVLIPALQPFYINERAKEVRIERISKASAYFKQQPARNNVPHPFL